MNIMEKAKRNVFLLFKDGRSLILLFIIGVVVFLSLFVYFIQNDKDRYIVTFGHLNKEGLYQEMRFLPKVEKEEQLSLFIDDILLGPVGDRYKLLFPRGTSVISMSLTDEKLYVNLSEEALYSYGDNSSSENKEGAEIFRKNVFRNFRNIDIINLYIDGRKMYAE